MANTPFSFDTEAEAILMLNKEGKKLEAIARKLWQKYIGSYSPKQYIRTGNSERAIKLGKVKKLDNNTFGIELTFDNDLSYHPSRFKGGKKGHSIMLISDGWHSKKLEKTLGRKVHRYTYFEGTGYLYQVYKEYMSIKHRGIEVDTKWNSNSVTKGK